MKKLKILELTNFSAGTCGVWQRVKQESELLSKKHEVKIFSSNATKGSKKIAKEKEKLGKIEIQRFPFKKLGGEGYLYWNSFEKSALEFNPDIIIAHSYRLPHTHKAIKIAEKTNSKVFLVTHAPFIKDNSTRNIISKIFVILYDKFIAPRTINKFDKIIAITHWEIPYLQNIGAKKEKIFYIPNGIPKQFFTQSFSKEQNKLLFLGRIAPIKNIEILINSMSKIKNTKLEIVGPAEQNYLEKLKSLIKEKNLEKQISFSQGIFDIKEKIKKIDSTKIFVLPSKREGMPQSLIEAMAREKIVIGSNNSGNADLIKHKENGLLFENNNVQDLTDKIGFALKQEDRKLQKSARIFVEQFEWGKIIDKIEEIL